MEHLDTLLGPLHMTKVSTAHVEALGKVQDIYMARIKSPTTDASVVMAMTDSTSNPLPLALLRELPWNTLTVRTYPSHQALSDAVHNIAPKKTFSSLTTQKLPKMTLGEITDVDLTTLESFRNYVIYFSKSNLPYKVALHASSKDEDFPHMIELAPALGTLNFTLTKL